MSILHYQTNNIPAFEAVPDDRYERNLKEDIKNGVDLIFKLKEEIDSYHPIASEVLRRILSY